MLRKIFEKQIPFALSLFLIACISSVSVFVFINFREKIYEYQLIISDTQKPSATFSLEYGSLAKMAEENFFEKVKSKLVLEKADFIEANLSQMKMFFYQGGEKKLEAEIVGKGRQSSWWETPAGIYRVETKEKIHFSSIGQVYMPYSMQFQGNFFIHGIPYYPDGRETDLSYTGGCIKIHTEDAKKFFELANLGTPVLVFEEEMSKDNFAHELKTPEVSAEAYLIADLKNNFVFFEKNSSTTLPIASITKLMTGIIATEYINLEKEIEIIQAMLPPTTVPRLKIGQTYKAYDLLFPLMTESSNEAAQALSYFIGPQRFITLMNQKAKSLGMEDAIFADSSGISPVNASNAKDLFVLAKYLYFNRDFILKLSQNKITDSAYGQPQFKDLANFNKPRNGESKNPPWSEFVGGKIGLTNASKQTLISIFETKIGGEIRPVVVIVLSSESVYKDTEEILAKTKVVYE